MIKQSYQAPEVERRVEQQVPQELLTWFENFVKMFNTEEHQTKMSTDCQSTLTNSSEFEDYLKNISEVSTLQPIVHRMIDFITEKQKTYILEKSQGDAKLLYNCLRVCNAIISNNFYTFEKKLN